MMPPADASSAPILETKLYVPRSPAGIVARPALTRRIREAAGSKLTVISAPAGSGKTTLLAEWLATGRDGESPPAWVSLDAGDNDPVAFWGYVVRALQKIQPDIGARALAMLHAHGSPSAAALTSLINDIDAADRDFVLILDDYHVIEAPAVHTALAFFLDHLPPRMQIVLATRADPLLPLARMRARGEVTELRAAELRFTPEEASAFLNQVMSLGLSPSDVAALARRTEGWVAGLKLAGLSLEGQADVRRFIDGFSGDNRFVADYLVEEVLQTQSEDVRRFLLATSVLERLSGPLCDAVTGETGAQARLELLEKSNLFVVALDDRRQWYRYHHLFAEVLQARAERDDPGHVKGLHARASAWYERSGEVEDAVRHALRAEDVERVAALLERTWPSMDRSYATGRWLARVRALPEAVVADRPVLAAGYAWSLLNAGELDAAEGRLRKVEASLADEGAPRIVADEARFRQLPRELAAARVYLAQSRGDITGSVDEARRLLELVPAGEHPWREMAVALLALAHWSAGDIEDAHRTFAEALREMRQGGDTHSVVRGMFVLGDLRRVQGRLSEAERTYRAGLDLAETVRDRSPETDELFLGMSELHAERGELDEAEGILRTLEQAAARTSHVFNRPRWCVAMAHLAAARGEHDRALDLLAEAEAHERPDPLPRVAPLPALRARIHIAQGRLDEAAGWAEGHGVSELDPPSYLREFEHVTLARLLLGREAVERRAGFAERALALLERIAAAAGGGGRQATVLETTVLRALAHQALGDTPAALDALARALELAAPERWLRVFLDEGPALQGLLRQAAARGVSHPYAARVLAAFEGAPAAPAPSPPARASAPTPAAAAPQLLTRRELEILRLISEGMRNQEIARHLFISPATVKRHVANVYAKLGASHRTEALRRASAIGIL